MQPSVFSVSSVVNPARLALSRNFGPTRPYRSSPHDHPTISLIKTSTAIRACSRTKSCAEPPTGSDSKKNRAATSGISVDSAPKLRQNFKNNSQCTLYQNSVLSATRIPHPSTIRTTRGFGCSATMCSLPSLMIPTPPPPNCPLFSQLD